MVASQGFADEFAWATIDEAWAEKLLIEKDLKLCGDIACFDGHRLTSRRFVFGVGEATGGKGEENGGDEVFHLMTGAWRERLDVVGDTRRRVFRQESIA